MVGRHPQTLPGVRVKVRFKPTPENDTLASPWARWETATCEMAKWETVKWTPTAEFLFVNHYFCK